MSLHQGYPFLSIPGPSMVPDRVLNAMHQKSPNIYSGELVKLTKICVKELKHVAGTEHHAAIYISNGHGAWDAAIANTLKSGDEILVLSTGRFGHFWGEMAKSQGVKIHEIDYGFAKAVQPEDVTEFLKNHSNIKAVLTVQSDTASSVRNDIKSLRAAIDAAGSNALFMVDCICSFGCEEFYMDEWGVDVMVSACQKGMMTPAGLGFVFFNEKAQSAREEIIHISHHWDWRLRAKPEVFYQHFNGTAPTHHIFGLHEALQMIKEEGLNHVWQRHAAMAQAVWAAVKAWGKGGDIRINIEDESARSHAVTTILTAPHDAGRLRRWTEFKAGVTLGIGLGIVTPERSTGDDAFRIGHMGHLNLPMMMGTLGAIDAGLKALDIPHGKGALEAASDILSKAVQKLG